MLFYILINILH